jgi:hypothetical protein
MTFSRNLAYVLVLLNLLPTLPSCSTNPSKEIYLIPATFEGKFRVVYGEACGVVPKMENGRRVMQIPENGLLIIQPEFVAGTVDNEYYFLEMNGKRTKIEEQSKLADQQMKSPRVVLERTGVIGGPTPDGGSSSRSPLAIHYADFMLYNKDTSTFDERQYILQETRLDSTTASLVDNCRKSHKI